MNIVIPSLLGVEAIISRELQEMGYDKNRITVYDGQVYLEVDDTGEALSDAVANINLNLRTGERVQIEAGVFPAKTFDELYDGVRELDWENWIPEGWAIHVRGYSRKSELFGIPACQRTIKKGIVERLLSRRGNSIGGVVPEDPDLGIMRIQFSILQDVVHFLVDTSGESLHKRGYRPVSNFAPLKETLAAAMLKIMLWEPFSDEALLDPFCGSGTIPIEAAMLAANVPPGLNRRFAAEQYPFLDTSAFERAREKGRDEMDTAAPDNPFIFASDIDKDAIALAVENATSVNVREFISFSRRDANRISGRDWLSSHPEFKRCLIIGNPPYGERMGDEEEVSAIHKALGENFFTNGGLQFGVRLGIITSNEGFESEIGVRADRRRKLYNGMIKCQFYQYYRHPRRPSAADNTRRL